jgi:hypothetical protein
MFGVGLGSKFNPIKASAIVDDEEEETINSASNIIRAQIVEEDHDKSEFT